MLFHWVSVGIKSWFIVLKKKFSPDRCLYSRNRKIGMAHKSILESG